MHIILILIFLIACTIIYAMPNRINKNKWMSIFGGIILFMYGALRSISVGIDTIDYAEAYLLVQNLSFEAIFSSSALLVSRDPIFYFFVKSLTFISKDPHLLLMIISAIVAISFSYFVYKNSVNPFMSFIMFIGLRYYSFTLTGLRQAVAWSLIFYSYEFIKKRQLKKFTLVIIVASLFHSSAILFILAYPLSYLRNVKKISLIIMFGLLLNFTTNNLFLKLLTKIPILQQYENYLYRDESAGTGITMIMIYILILCFSYIMRKKIDKKSTYFYLMYNLSIVGLGITLLSFNYANIFRIGYYFIFPIVLILPISIKSSFNKKSEVVVSFLVILLLVAQYIIIGPGAGTDNYDFFWKID